jgi:hypothetical protein
MDFGGFILFLLLAVGLLVGSLFVVAAFFARSPRRWRTFGLWLGGLMLLAIFGCHLYQVFWLDEALFLAAARGNAAQVKVLLSAGADPNAKWEDGTSALSAAQTGGHEDIMIMLERAGAVK